MCVSGETAECECVQTTGKARVPTPVSMLAVSCYYYELCTPQEMELNHFYGLIVENLMVPAYLSKRRGCRVAFVLSDAQHYCWSIIDAH